MDLQSNHKMTFRLTFCPTLNSLYIYLQTDLHSDFQLTSSLAFIKLSH